MRTEVAAPAPAALRPSRPEPGPAPVGDAPAVGGSATAPPSHLRLRRFLGWLALFSAGVAAAEVGSHAATGDPALLLGALVPGALAGPLLLARHLVGRGRVEAAVALVMLTTFAGALAYSAALPGSVLSLALLPVLLVALGMPHLRRRSLRRVAAASWVGGSLLVALNLLAAPSPALSSPAFPAVRAGVFAGVLALVLVLLLHHHHRLQESLAGARAANLALRTAHHQLRGLDRMKTRFLNTTAHELCTPLTPIVLQVELLRSGALGPLDERQRRAVAIVERNVARLRTLLDDVLDVGRIDTRALRLVHQPVEVDQLVDEVAESFHDVAARAGVALELCAERGLRLDGDPKRLAQVMFNLVGNALKFTPRGGHVLVVARADGDHVELRVEDDGPGIRREDLGRLFQPFVQVHDPRDHTRSGVGMGLYICRGIVEAHGGRIGCASDGLGLGATFTVRLPVTRPAAAPLPLVAA